MDYDFEAKQAEYRAPLWAWIDAHLWSVPITRRTVCYLDTRQAIETQYLLSLGYAPENLHPCNREPVEVALLTTQLDRLGLPRVKTHGIDILRVVGTLPFTVVNFDGCGQIGSFGTVRTILGCARTMTAKSVLAVNVLAGRETGAAAAEINRWRQRPVWRFDDDSPDGGEWIPRPDQNAHALRRKWLRELVLVKRGRGELLTRWTPMAETTGDYMSASGQRMIWAAWKLRWPARRTWNPICDGLGGGVKKIFTTRSFRKRVRALARSENLMRQVGPPPARVSEPPSAATGKEIASREYIRSAFAKLLAGTSKGEAEIIVKEFKGVFANCVNQGVEGPGPDNPEKETGQ